MRCSCATAGVSLASEMWCRVGHDSVLFLFERVILDSV